MQVTKFNGKVTEAAEALEMANLNWGVGMDDLMTMGGAQCPRHRAVVRTDTNEVIGVVKGRYTPVDNATAFSFFDVVCKQHDVRYEKAIVNNNGAYVRLRSRVNGDVNVRKNDAVRQYVDLVNTFDGTSRLKATFYAERLVCTNGLVAFRKENEVSLIHTKNVVARMGDALNVFDRAVNYFDRFIKLSKELAKKSADHDLVTKFISNLEGEPRTEKQEQKYEDIYGLFEAGRGTGKGTRWDMYNAYVEWIDHHRGRDENRDWHSLTYYKGHKERAFDLALNL